MPTDAELAFFDAHVDMASLTTSTTSLGNDQTTTTTIAGIAGRRLQLGHVVAGGSVAGRVVVNFGSTRVFLRRFPAGEAVAWPFEAFPKVARTASGAGLNVQVTLASSGEIELSVAAFPVRE